MAGPISVSGLNKLLRSFDKTAKDVEKAAMEGLQKAGLEIIADAQRNLRANSSVVTGLLRQSGKVQKVDDLTLDVGFFDSQNKQSGYAHFVEYGRRAGRMPPPDELAQWAYKKYQLHDRKLARQVGWGMAIEIAKHGTQPHPFFVPAIEKNKSKIVSAIRDSVNKETR
jgi:HK97 gp10 family phage protein